MNALANAAAVLKTRFSGRSRQAEVASKQSLQESLMLIDSRPSSGRNAADSALFHAPEGAQNASVPFKRMNEEGEQGIKGYEAGKEMAVVAQAMNVQATPHIKTDVNGAVSKQELGRQMHNIVADASDGPVVGGNETSAFAVLHESGVAKETEQEVRAELSLNLFTPEERKKMQEFESLAIATNFENNNVLEGWRSEIMTIYQKREAEGTLSSAIMQELASRVGAIGVRIEYNNETTNTMQHA